MRHAQVGQGLRGQRQHLALARQQHHLTAGQALIENEVGHRLCSLRRFEAAQAEVGFLPGLRQRVAPDVFCASARGLARHVAAQRTTQPVHAATGRCIGGVSAKRPPAILRHRHLEHRIHRRDHLRCVAPGVVAAQQHAIQSIDDEFLRGQKHPRLGTAKAVDALLGVADDENPWRALAAGAAARAGV